MYGWIWRRLPFGLAGKLAGSTLLIVGALAGLWFWAFPAAEPLLPFDDVQVSTDDRDGGPGHSGSDQGGVLAPTTTPTRPTSTGPGQVPGSTPSTTATRR